MLKKAEINSLKIGDEVYIISINWRFFAAGKIVDINPDPKWVLVEYTGFDTDKFDVKTLFNGKIPNNRRFKIGDKIWYKKSVLFVYNE